ncbi:hypothetical protein WOLCODRAFT_159806 [Wolfiporia cocos MD-104 SS10]|uniref:DUF6534 domain-containing protein n=1 Tax=Wolfiporia cocos (strain MD-104) TaxID=742152 RepID=A0A2H3ISU4_WOLCO|nr:hypothetical protein WOLCODRAFT_159806 [Wolfiporia cocos MD-104 SS10]
MLFVWAFQGVLSVQIYMFHSFFPDERPLLKALVIGLYVFECVQTVLITVDTFDIYVYSHADYASVTAPLNLWFSSLIMNAMASVTVQWYFAWRLYIVSKSIVLLAGICFLAFIQAGAGFTSGIMQKEAPSLVNYRPVHPVTMVNLIGCALVDSIIAISMTVTLLRARSNVLAYRTPILNRIIRLGIGTGTLTASVAIVVLAMAFGSPQTFLFETLGFVISQFYVNSLVTNLNSRHFLRAEQQVVDISLRPSIWKVTDGRTHTLATTLRDPDYEAQPPTLCSTQGEVVSIQAPRLKIRRRFSI